MYYYGQKYEYFDQMDLQQLNIVYEGLHRVIAKDNLRAFTVADFPMMKSKDKNKLHRELTKVANPDAFKEKIVSTDDLLKMGFDQIGQ